MIPIHGTARWVCGFALAVVAATVSAQDESLPPRAEWRATASGTEIPALAPKFAIDNDPATKWGGSFSAGHWLQVDLGRVARVGGLLLQWDLAFATSYEIQTSLDGQQWNPVYETSDSPGTSDYVFFAPVRARFLRLAALPRTAEWGGQCVRARADRRNRSADARRSRRDRHRDWHLDAGIASRVDEAGSEQRHA